MNLINNPRLSLMAIEVASKNAGDIRQFIIRCSERDSLYADEIQKECERKYNNLRFVYIVDKSITDRYWCLNSLEGDVLVESKGDGTN